MRSFCLSLLLACQGTFAVPYTTPSAEAIYDTVNKTWFHVDQFAITLNPGQTLIIGERHATESNKGDAGIQIEHANQVLLLNMLRQRRIGASVGMEFLEYTNQPIVDDFLADKISDDQFKAAVRWGANPFDFYRDQIKAPAMMNGRTAALNIPRSISAKVAKNGVDGLDASDRALLPPIWERGSDLYFSRFEDAMKGHATATQIENYFLAQSLWDDTMAWRIWKHRMNHLDFMMVIAGEFHVEYNLGLPARLKKYGVSDVKTLVHVEIDQWNDEKMEEAVKPDPNLGNLADYIWVYTR